MTELLNGIAKSFTKGDYDIVVNSPGGAGTAVVQFSYNGKGFQDIPDANFTGSDFVGVWLTGSEVKATITGDSTVDLIER